MLQMVKNRLFPIALGILGAIGLFQTLSIFAGNGRETVAYSNSFLSVWFCVLSAVSYEKVYKKTFAKEKKGYLLESLFSFGLAVALTVGKQLETVENLNITKAGIWITIAILTVYFIPYVSVAWEWMKEVWKQDDNVAGRTQEKGKVFLRQWLIIFLCWIPVFLAFYPGAFVYDASDEYVQVATRIFTTHHPLAHVLLLGGFVCAGNAFFDSYNIGIALYTLCQMLFLSGVFSYTVSYIREKIKNKYIIWGMIGFYGFFPVIPMYAVCSSKDTIFTGAFLIVTIKMLQMFENTGEFFENKGNVAFFMASAVIMMLFRNNGFYAYVVWGFVVFLAYLLRKINKRDCLKVILIMFSSIVIFLGCSKILTVATKAEQGGKQEMLTVPIQQMVRTYLYSPETYTEEEKELLFKVIPQEELHLYTPRLSDLLKSKFDNQKFQENKEEFIKLWVKVGVRKPMIYLNAWLMTSYGYWYPDAVINVYGGIGRYTFTYQDSSYFGFETEYPGIRESKFPWLEEQYRKISLELFQQKVPGVSMLFSPGFLLWCFLFFVFFFLKNKEWNRTLGLAGILLLWLTAVLGPTYLVRYVLILWFALPVIIAETKIQACNG